MTNTVAVFAARTNDLLDGSAPGFSDEFTVVLRFGGEIRAWTFEDFFNMTDTNLSVNIVSGDIPVVPFPLAGLDLDPLEVLNTFDIKTADISLLTFDASFNPTFGERQLIAFLLSSDPVSVSFDVGDPNDRQLIVQFGNVSAVPLPAAPWLFIAALGGLVGVHARNKNRIENSEQRRRHRSDQHLLTSAC
ncbi:MAG: VPLPA-CTERM sorting domain-containing protein [Pseudomonadota bacterium]